MRRPLAFAAIALLSVFPASLRAQQPIKTPSPPTRDPHAIALVQAALNALDRSGLHNGQLDTVTTGTVRYAIANPPETKQIVIKSRGLSLVRYELTGSTGTSSRVVNNGKATIQNIDGKVNPLVPNNLVAEKVQHLPSLSILADLTSPELSIEFKGAGTVRGQATYRVALYYSRGVNPIDVAFIQQISRTIIDFDQATGLPVKMERAHSAENHPGKFLKEELYYGNYQNIANMLVPTFQQRYVDGHLISELTIQTVTLGSGVSDADFVLPTVR